MNNSGAVLFLLPMNILLALFLAVWQPSVDGGVSFTLRNASLKSIPLEIPGYMNPNLSPMSNSGVTLNPGQDVYFKEGKKRYLLLEVSADLQGDTLVVNELIEKRKKELGL